MLNLQHLLALETIAAAGSLAGAAAELNVSQSALTQALRGLERRLGVELFLRGGAGTVPTEAGARVVVRVGRMRACLEDGLAAGARKVGDRAARTSGLRRLTAVRLRYFSAVALNRSFTLAARELGVSQPSVHRAVSDTEDVIGVPCFVNQRRGVAVTPAGETFARQAGLTLAELRQIEEEASEHRGEVRGRVAVGSLPLGHVAVLPAAVIGLLADFPNAAVTVVDGTYPDLLRDLRHGRIDWLVGALRNPAPAGDVIEEPLFDEGLAVFARPAHPALAWTEFPAPRLAELAWITPRRGTPARGRFEAFFTAAGVPLPTRVIECGSILTARELMKQSDHVGLLSTQQLATETETGQLAVLCRWMHGAERPIGLTMRRDWQPTRAQRAFTDRLRDVGRALPERVADDGTRPARSGRGGVATVG